MTIDEIKNVILEIIQDIDDEADLENLNPGDALRDQLDLDAIRFKSPRRTTPNSPPWTVASTISCPA